MICELSKWRIPEHKVTCSTFVRYFRFSTPEAILLQEKIAHSLETFPWLKQIILEFWRQCSRKYLKSMRLSILQLYNRERIPTSSFLRRIIRSLCAFGHFPHIWWNIFHAQKFTRSQIVKLLLNIFSLSVAKSQNMVDVAKIAAQYNNSLN